MSGRLFWIFTALCVGIAVHLATVLYGPGLAFNRKLNAVAAAQKPNHFFLMVPEAQSGFLPTSSDKDIVGLCLIDLSHGKVTVNAHVPQSFWNFTIYNTRGQQVYAINDAEAGADTFTVEVASAKSLIEQLRGKPEADDAGKITNSGWHAEINGTSALAVMWLSVPNAAQRKMIEDEVMKTNCAGSAS